MLDAVQRSVALKACYSPYSVSAFRAHPREAAPPDIRVREVAWLYELRGKDLGDTLSTGSSRDPYFGDFTPRTPEIGYESVEDPTPRRWTVSPSSAAHFTDGSRIEGKVGAALTEWRDGRETWYSTLRPRSLLHGGDGRAAKGDTGRMVKTGWSTFSVTQVPRGIGRPEDLSPSGP
ncbi:hypothetical protein EVAR_59911_1 [Eumeta japonica]|uniref:Uncharacterized protein n=1 Tax=Eumeta variegata TaxID=151549 RepID=A0A4C2AI27_EUMVA|nr:hypothetical protein EVAR_59911_1 [Eumeta japonica]